MTDKYQLTINIEEDEHLKMYAQTRSVHADLWKFREKLRALDKYEIPDIIKTPEDAIEHVRYLFNDFLGRYLDY